MAFFPSARTAGPVQTTGPDFYMHGLAAGRAAQFFRGFLANFFQFHG
ncbi:hypothetical protein BN1183_AA_00560 [Pantoea ananatis]|nr:hypothetical protein BN1183_AA_00560 [Pantoea ananatis]